jgi:hypothetical protein
MTTPHPLAEYWKPAYLHRLGQLAQATSDCAAAALDTDTEPAISGTRFVTAYRRLYQQLEPFAQHDLDDPSSWPPGADRALVVDLLTLLLVLVKLEPPAEVAPVGRGGTNIRCCDGKEAAVNLKEMSPTVRRFQQIADLVYQRIRDRLAGPVVSRVAGGTPLAFQETPAQTEAPARAAPLPATDPAAEPSREQRALALLLTNPGWPAGRLAKELGCSRATLYRSKIIKTALQSRRGSKRNLPCGFKDRGGRFDAWREDE